MLELERQVDRILYFGDVDGKGLEIPLLATATTARFGLPEVEPCSRLYRLLFDLARPVPSDSKPLAPSAARHRVAWLSPDLRTTASHLLQTGLRLPQEAVGYKALAATLAEACNLASFDSPPYQIAPVPAGGR